ncbi:MAG: hypothetical protein ABI697_01490 [Devosia sp.]
MKYLVEVERPIFLHFLNREAALASQQARGEVEDLEAINALTVCHCSGLTVNISQMVEYAAGKSRLISTLVGLSQSGILASTSHDSTMSEFIASRQRIYRNVASKYPMYFGTGLELEGFRISKSNSFSMTNLLRRDLLDQSGTELSLIGKRARPEDAAKVVANLDVLQTIAFKHRDDAITRANFEFLADKGTLTPDVLDATGRMFSALYFEHYASQNGAATCTGMTEVGFVENLEHFPHYDVPVLRAVLRSLGWEAMAGVVRENLRRELETLYRSESHRLFVEYLNAFLGACLAAANSASAASILATWNPGTQRSTVINIASHLLRDSRALSSPPATLLLFFDEAMDALRRAASVGSSLSEEFRAAWGANAPPKNRVSVLMVTATEVEDEALDAGLVTAGFILSGSVNLGRGYAELYSRGTHHQVVHVRSGAGSSGANGSELVVYDALKAVEADFAIAVGICFGLKKATQSLGDVLVSESIVDYETVRVGEAETRERGVRQPSGTRLLSAAQIVKRAYGSAEHRVFLGPMLSGQKLVDNETLVGDLRARYPDALGGEMEGNGIVGACTRASTEWIIVKGICDWGFKKRGNHQVEAANNAVGVAIRVAIYVLDAQGSRLLESK